MREGCVCIGTTVNAAARVRYSLGAASGHYTQDGGYNGQHENEASYSYGNGKGALGDTQGILQGLERKKEINLN